jgi:DNA-binding response OmpR family regulator
VETAGDGDTAIRRASGEPFDLIVLDVMLPGRDGFEVARALRQRLEHNPMVPQFILAVHGMGYKFAG